MDPAVNGEGDVVCVAVLDEHPEPRSSSIKAQRLSIVASNQSGIEQRMRSTTTCSGFRHSNGVSASLYMLHATTGGEPASTPAALACVNFYFK